MKRQVFLSYALADKEWAREFAKDLADRGFDVWFDEADLAQGESFQSALESALRDSDSLIVLISESSVANPNVLFEIGAALGGGKQLIPVRIGSKDARLPFNLKGVATVFEESPREAAKAVAAAL